MTNAETNEFLIVGPPGTGKTSTLQRQVESDVAREGPDAVLITSLTRAAAAEVAGRKLPIPKERVGTLHAHCYRALGHPRLTEDHLDEWNEAAPEYAVSGGQARDVDDPYSATPEDDRAATGDALLSRYQLLRARLTPRGQWPLDLVGFAARWETWKHGRDLLDFADLIDVALETVPRPPGEPRYLYVDEAQDHDAAELRLLRAWGSHVERLYLIGDADQAIFEWRGADPRAFLHDGRVPPERLKVLSQSHRVPHAVHALAMRWIEQITGRLSVEYRPTPDPGDVRSLPDATWRYPEGLLPDIETRIAAGKTVMVLASCGYMLRPLLALLRREGVPFHNPYRRRQGAWNPLHAGNGTTMAERLLAFLRPHPEHWGEEARVWTPQDLKPWVDVLRSDGTLLHGAKAAVGRLAGTATLTDDELCTFFAPQTLMDALTDPLPWFEGHVLPAKSGPLSFPLEIVRQHGTAALREEPRVVVGTIHSVKGGESDCVYIFPDLSLAGATEWQSHGPARDALVRLFYVGLTRAKHSVVLCGPATRNAVGLASA